MAADVEGTTYFSYRGPSPHDTSVASHGNRNTIRSVHSNLSDRGDNNDITTLAVRPYQSNAPSQTSQSILLLSPPYPGYHLHPSHYANGNGYTAPSSTPFDPMIKDDASSMSPIVHPDYTKSTETLRQCVLLMGVIFLLVFGVTIFMAVYYGNNYSS